MFKQPSKILDPKADIVFKKVFGNHPKVLRSFLNSLLPLPYPIRSLTYLSPELVPEIPEMKYTIVDVKCTDEVGRSFIVEMQMCSFKGFQAKLLLGTSRVYSDQLKSGKKYSELAPVYGLGILNDVMGKKKKDWYHHYKVTNTGDPLDTLEGLELIFIELPKFKPQTIVDKKMMVLWLRFLELTEGAVDIPKELLENPEIHEAVEALQECSFTRGELEHYRKYWDSVSKEATILDQAEHAEERGLKQGLEQGLERGLEQGREEGEKVGEQKARHEIMQKLKALGMSEEAIMKVVG